MAGIESLANRAKKLEREQRATLERRVSSRKRPEVLEPAEAERVALAREDVNAFAEYISDQPQADYHKRLQACADRYRYLLVEGPPEVGKSQQLTLRRVCWLIGRNPEMTVGVVGAKAEQAYEWIRAIGQVLDSKRYRRVFPHIKHGKVWGSERLEVKRKSSTITSPTVQGIGIGGSFLGARLNLVILDDVLNAINTATKEQRRKVLDWIDGSMCVGRLLAGGSLVFLANTWTNDDAMHELSKRLDTDGKPIYHYQRDPLPDDPDAPGAVSPVPEIWPLARMRERKAVVGGSKWRWQYTLQPRGQDDSRFDPAWFDTASPKRWTPPPRLLEGLIAERTRLQRERAAAVEAGDVAEVAKLAGQLAELSRQIRENPAYRPGFGEQIVIGMDIGIGLKDRHDQSAWVVYVRTPDNVRHVIYVERARLTGPKLVERMAVLEAAYPGCTFRVETVAAQKHLAQFAGEQISAPIAYHVTTGTGETITSKAFGIEKLALRCEAGQCLIARAPGGGLAPEAEALRDGLLWYTPKEHTEDSVMALLFAEMQFVSFGDFEDLDRPAEAEQRSEGARLLYSDA